MCIRDRAEEISSTQKLRVGYYAYTGFNMIDADGSYSGYSYELLQKIARYRNVIYEYDGYDGDVNDVMQMLELSLIHICVFLHVLIADVNRRTQSQPQALALAVGVAPVSYTHLLGTAGGEKHRMARGRYGPPAQTGL